MASTKRRTSCGHPANRTCPSCGVCKQCFADRSNDLLAAKAEISNLTTALGRSAAREEQLRQYISSPQHRPQERDERDLAIARIAILRRRLAQLGKQHPDVEAAVIELLRFDDATRTRPIEDVLLEASLVPKST